MESRGPRNDEVGSAKGRKAWTVRKPTEMASRGEWGRQCGWIYRTEWQGARRKRRCQGFKPGVTR